MGRWDPKPPPSVTVQELQAEVRPPMHLEDVAWAEPPDIGADLTLEQQEGANDVEPTSEESPEQPAP